MCSAGHQWSRNDGAGLNEKSTESESKQLEMFIMILQSNSIPVTYNNKNLYFALIF